MASVQDMFMLADSTDCILIVFGSIGAIVNGCGDTMMMYFFAGSMQALSGSDDILDVMTELAYFMIILAGILQVAAMCQYGCYGSVAKRQAHKLREQWFKAVMRQDMEWFDLNNPGEMPALISTSIIKYEEGIGKKFSEFLQQTTTFAFGLFLAFFFNPYVALVVLGLVPFLAGAGHLLITVTSEAAEVTQKSYSRAGAVAYELFTSLKTLLSMNATGIMTDRYFKEAIIVEAAGMKRSLKVGIANGSMMGSFILMYLVITFFGGWMLSVQISEDGCDPSGGMDPRNKCDKFGLPSEANASSIVIAMVCVAFGGQALGQVASAIQAFSVARAAVKSGFDVIRRIPVIDNQSEEGLKPDKIVGNISIENMSFNYPTRPGEGVCKNYSLEIPAGKTIALVGASGSGKSTGTFENEIACLPSYTPFFNACFSRQSSSAIL